MTALNAPLHRLRRWLARKPAPCETRRNPDCARHVPSELRADLGLPGTRHIPGEALRKTLW